MDAGIGISGRDPRWSGVQIPAAPPTYFPKNLRERKIFIWGNKEHLGVLMPTWRYSVELDPEKTVKASLRDVSMSYKFTVETLRLIRGKSIGEAKKILEEIINMKRAVPLRRYKKKVGHKSTVSGPGRYPVKVAKNLLKLLDNLENNAEFKGLNVENVRIVHAAAHKGMKIRNYLPRAFGRATPYYDQLVHVEVVGEEVS